MAGPTTLQEYYTAAIGPDLANKITGTFGKDVAADIAIYLYAGDNKEVDPRHTGVIEQNAVNVSNGALMAWGQDMEKKADSMTTASDRLAFMSQVENTLGGSNGQKASAALEDYYTAKDQLIATHDNSYGNAALSASARFMEAMQSAVDTAHNAPNAYTQGIMANTDTDFAKANGPTAQANMDIIAYAAARSAQSGGMQAYAYLEQAARGKMGYDHGAFSTDNLNPANADKLQQTLQVIEQGGDAATLQEKFGARRVREALEGGNPTTIFNAVSELSAAQFVKLNGGQAYGTPSGQGNPDEQAALSAMGFAPPPAPPVAPVKEQPGSSIFNFNAVPSAPETAPPTVQHESYPLPPAAVKALPVSLQGLGIQGGEEHTGTTAPIQHVVPKIPDNAAGIVRV